jgi:hypothetical protein
MQKIISTDTIESPLATDGHTGLEFLGILSICLLKAVTLQRNHLGQQTIEGRRRRRISASQRIRKKGSTYIPNRLNHTANILRLQA